MRLTADNLRPLLSNKTKLVTCTHTSNILGTIHDIKAIADEVHKIPGALLCVDGVAFAPHREVDVKALGVDFYSFSWYKVHITFVIVAQWKKKVQGLIIDGWFYRSTALILPFFTARKLPSRM